MSATIAKLWFRSNPRNVVTFHHRWDKLSDTVKTMFSAPREAVVKGDNVIFNSPRFGRSEELLFNIKATIADNGDLSLRYSGGKTIMITFRIPVLGLLQPDRAMMQAVADDKARERGGTHAEYVGTVAFCGRIEFLFNVGQAT